MSSYHVLPGLIIVGPEEDTQLRIDQQFVHIRGDPLSAARELRLSAKETGQQFGDAEFIVWAVGQWVNLLCIAWFCHTIHPSQENTLIIDGAEPRVDIREWTHVLKSARRFESSEIDYFSYFWKEIAKRSDADAAFLRNVKSRVPDSPLCRRLAKGLHTFEPSESLTLSPLDQNILQRVAQAGQTTRMNFLLAELIADECGVPDFFLRDRIARLISSNVLRVNEDNSSASYFVELGITGKKWVESPQEATSIRVPEIRVVGRLFSYPQERTSTQRE